MDVMIPSLVGDRIVPGQPLSLINPLRMSGILRPLIKLCRINAGQTDLLTKRSSPKRTDVGSKLISASTKKAGILKFPKYVLRRSRSRKK